MFVCVLLLGYRRVFRPPIYGLNFCFLHYFSVGFEMSQVVWNIVSRFCSLNVILKCLKTSVLPRSLGTSSESAKEMLAFRIVSPILMLILWV